MLYHLKEVGLEVEEHNEEKGKDSIYITRNNLSIFFPINTLDPMFSIVLSSIRMEEVQEWHASKTVGEDPD